MKDGCPPPFTLQPHLQTFNCWFSECTLEAAFAKISENKSKIAADTMECLKKMSPLSLKVTYKQIKEAAKLDVHNCFNVDYRIATKMLACGDFYEGEKRTPTNNVRFRFSPPPAPPEKKAKSFVQR